MPPQQANNGWTPVDAASPAGWEEVPSTGMKMPPGTIGSDKDTVLGGMARRLGQTISGAYHTVADPPSAEEQKRGATGNVFERPALVAGRLGKGVVEGEKEAGKQTAEQYRRAKADPDLVGKGLGMARAGVTAASMADPFATGPVTNVNKLSDEGRYKEALGAGTFDALTLLAGRNKVGPETKLNKLAYATGAESIRPLDHILPDIEATVAKVGKPRTVGQLQTVIQKLMNWYEQQFNKGLFTTKGPIDASPIADALEQRAKSLPPTREGQAIARKIRSTAAEYRKPWSPVDLNKERMFRNANTQSFHQQSATGQMAAMRANADTMIDETVAESSRDVLYDEMERQHPGQGYRELKQKQSSVLEMQGKFQDHVEKLEAAQARKEGAPIRDKVSTSTSVHPGGVTPRLHGIGNLIPGGGPLKSANRAVASAFRTGRSATKSAILALPVSTLALPRGATVPPVPGGDEDEGPQE